MIACVRFHKKFLHPPTPRPQPRSTTGHVIDDILTSHSVASNPEVATGMRRTREYISIRDHLLRDHIEVVNRPFRYYESPAIHAWLQGKLMMLFRGACLHWTFNNKFSKCCGGCPARSVEGRGGGSPLNSEDDIRVLNTTGPTTLMRIQACANWLGSRTP